MPANFTDPDHAMNGKRLVWATYDHMLEQLIPSRCSVEPSPFVGGFRCARRRCPNVARDVTAVAWVFLGASLGLLPNRLADTLARETSASLAVAALPQQRSSPASSRCWQVRTEHVTPRSELTHLSNPSPTYYIIKSAACCFAWGCTSSHCTVSNVDLDEVWRALGISGCPQCLCRDGNLAALDVESTKRTFATTMDVIRTSRRLLLERGNITSVAKLLRRHRLSVLHTKSWNPFLLLPHTDFDCFPQDHLHGVYVHVTITSTKVARCKLSACPSPFSLRQM